MESAAAENRDKSDVEPVSALSSEKPSGEMALETNEDSSYDSDFETDEACTSHADVSHTQSTIGHQNVSRSSSAGLSTHHDVSRTVSDTLGAEFAEYVNSDQHNASAQTEDIISQTKRLPGYTTRVEFALKLGYTEMLVQTALQKLGPEPSTNELLAELIKLGAQTPRLVISLPNSEDASSGDSNYHSTSQLRPIVIDGSNVAMSHGNKDVYSCRGIKICVDWFKARGHKEITVFVPRWRKEASRPDNPVVDREILDELERERLLVYTPSRLVSGKRYVCYDDRYILKLAAQIDGIVVSNDNYRDLLQENSDFRRVIEERILMYSFVNDRFMPPDDPMGRLGPTLDKFLSVTSKRTEQASLCPYGKKCTYGNKCKYNHPERGNMPHKSVTERLSEYAQKQIQARGNTRELNQRVDLKTNSLPLSYESQGAIPRKMPLSRTRSAAPALPPPDPMSHASVVSNFNRAQREYHQALSPDYPLSRKMESPPKSHSIDNISSSFNDLNLSGPSHLGREGINYPQQTSWSSTLQVPSNGDSSSWGVYVENRESPETANMHRKLQRQLTLNPNYDPRLYRMHGCNQNGAPQQCNVQTTWGGHQSVGRIASAPAACPAWGGTWTSGPSPSPPHRDARTHIHYHLASIFPEDKVQKAMALLPDETNPQNICAAIINQK